MRKILILSVRKNTDPSIAKLEAEYVKRLSSNFNVEISDVRHTYAETSTAPLIQKKEAGLLSTKIPKPGILIILTERGKTYTSPAFSVWFQKIVDTAPQITFVIGGPYGLDPELVRQADHALSLSPLTFTHEHARLLLLEQLYRASTIQNRTNYHK